ncbi:hypothetical protein WMY93_027803 [Mugilogobius chulae]|uniref:SAND domain-containing protein n=1 Tax=Mugilogobius chulae TaxID=88201 RepID=A0AAW0N521_9GOBI
MKNVGQKNSKKNPSTQRLRKKPNTLCFSPLLREKSYFPVTCGELAGILHRDKLEKGEKCIVANSQWYTPSHFEKRAGKGANKNWKSSICYRGTPLGTLLKKGYLKCPGYKTTKKAKKLPSLTEENSTEKREGNIERLAQWRSSSHRILKVTCENISGSLHTKRFASGTCGRSIRTDNAWMTPAEFVKEASCQTDSSWEKDIKCEGKPLGTFVEVPVHYRISRL